MTSTDHALVIDKASTVFNCVCVLVEQSGDRMTALTATDRRDLEQVLLSFFATGKATSKFAPRSPSSVDGFQNMQTTDAIAQYIIEAIGVYPEYRVLLDCVLKNPESMCIALHKLLDEIHAVAPQ
jgi:hypothetical protein